MITVTANLDGTTSAASQHKFARRSRELGDPPPARERRRCAGRSCRCEQMLDGLADGPAARRRRDLPVARRELPVAEARARRRSRRRRRRSRASRSRWRSRGTTLNIQSFMGAIMAVGVAVANAILLVTFAERSRIAGSAGRAGRRRRRAEPAAADPDDELRDDRRHAAARDRLRRRRRADRAAGTRRGRGPRGGTAATLLVLPAVFAIVQGRAHRRSASLDPDDPLSGHYVSP